MSPFYNAYPELAATILDWWETGALSVNIVGLFVNFFFTMHKGKRYRTAFVLLLVCLLTLLYVDVITPASVHIQADDMIRPIMYSAWAYTVWTRAWIYLDYFVQLRGQYEATIEQVLSAENTVVPWKETALFATELEKWQKWGAGALAVIFAVGLLYSNVDKIETLQRVSINTHEQARKENRKTQRVQAELKRQQDSLFLEGLISETKRVELLISKIDAATKTSTSNQKLLLQERRDKQRLLEYLKGLQQSVNSRLQPMHTLPPKSSSNWQIPTDKVQPYPPIIQKRKIVYEPEEASFPEEADTSIYARKE